VPGSGSRSEGVGQQFNLEEPKMNRTEKQQVPDSEFFETLNRLLQEASERLSKMHEGSSQKDIAPLISFVEMDHAAKIREHLDRGEVVGIQFRVSIRSTYQREGPPVELEKSWHAGFAFGVNKNTGELKSRLSEVRTVNADDHEWHGHLHLHATSRHYGTCAGFPRASRK
jgi:hypothetical protein